MSKKINNNKIIEQTKTLRHFDRNPAASDGAGSSEVEKSLHTLPIQLAIHQSLPDRLPLVVLRPYLLLADHWQKQRPLGYQ